MAVVSNIPKPRVDKDGNLQRTKIKGYLPISFGYGIYLGDSFDDRSQGCKVFFLMLSVDASRAVAFPQQLLSSPANSGLGLDEISFSKKFSISDDFVNSFKAGSDYWFYYTSEATNSLIDSKAITYESLQMLAASDIPGLNGLHELLSSLKLAKPAQQNS